MYDSNIAEFYISIIPLIVLNGGFCLGYVFFLISGRMKRRPNELQDRSTSFIVTGSLQNYWYWITEPFVKLMAKLGIGPNFITLAGIPIAVFAGFLYSKSAWGAAGWFMILGGIFDILDGRVARATNSVTKAGGFLDSVSDRFSDGFVLTGLAFAFRDHWLFFFVLLCFTGFFTVAYARARSDANGVPCAVGIFQRPERIYSLGLASIFTPLLSYYAGVQSPVLIYLVIIVLGIGTNITAAYRTYYSFSRLNK